MAEETGGTEGGGTGAEDDNPKTGLGKMEYETVFKAVEDAVFLFDVERDGDGEPRFVFRGGNPSHERATEMEADGCLGTPLRELFDGDGERLLDEYRRCVETEETVTYETTLEHGTGSVEWRTKITPVVEGGTATSIVGVARDVTERNKRRTELQRKEAMLQHTTDVVLLVDENGRIRYQNHADEAVLGHSTRDLTGASVTEYIHPEDSDGVEAMLAEALDSPEEVISGEHRYRTPDGEWRWYETRVRSLLDTPPIEGFLVSARDITERKAYEERLESQRSDLEVLNEVVRHDIRNDLQLVTAYAEMLEDHVDEEGQEFLDILQSSTANAVELTRTARDLATVLLQDDAETQRVSLERSLEQQVEAVRSAHSGAAVTIDGSVPDIHVAGTDMLEAVFRNLLSNAIQHNDKALPEVTVSVTEHDSEVEIRVADNGPGVPDAHKEAIFGKGERGLESEGTGIGLYLVKTLVESFGGDVCVEDNEPEGSVFVVRLPVAD
ncbi:sensor box histidine kinase [Natronomonas pharaonis DSM 2160]|uniref:histidine kinase n=1 Tax=Natronomonas pharaonis (strain ATCC 35678 / DSM 2160 / CIP 103997 / JCM 8858 / NBRC 14720 / NCIMB 2260 / Gabara) TaxID=348780 RepID=A0A1U7EUM9_NATPD|nr:PAS domain-containing sensor histidine kinase [Natronomonas pharaonis]CAI48668.1 sensor box histidine kinase [Natronomonas pharaonis DSM 2160]